MFESILSDFKNAWRKPNNSVVRIITINVVVFVALNIILVFGAIFNAPILANIVHIGFYIPAPITEFVFRFWTLITYFFTHTNFLHILFNMMAFYWFGLFVQGLIGSSRVIAIYVYGGIAGGLAYLIAFNTIDFFIANTPQFGMLGASASVYAMITAAAVLAPDSEMTLFLFGNVKIKYLAAITIFLSFIGIASNYSEAGPGGNLAHLAGAALGYVYVRQLRKGNDWGKPLYRLLHFFATINFDFNTKKTAFFKPETTKTGAKKETGKQATSETMPSQEQIDAILDKISAKGYESLTTEEKQMLFKASNKK